MIDVLLPFVHTALSTSNYFSPSLPLWPEPRFFVKPVAHDDVDASLLFFAAFLPSVCVSD